MTFLPRMLVQFFVGANSKFHNRNMKAVLLESESEAERTGISGITVTPNLNFPACRLVLTN